jgi:hypothetical protein
MHRALGTHISKMKSTTLDKWSPQMFHLFETVDNEISNAYWEANMPKGYNKPVESSGSYAVEMFLRDKYERKLWIGGGPDPLTLSKQPKNSDRPQLKLEKKEEKRTLSAGPLDADLLSDSTPHLHSHTASHLPHLSASSLPLSKTAPQVNHLHSQQVSFPQTVPTYNQNNVNLFPNSQPLSQFPPTTAAGGNFGNPVQVPPITQPVPAFPQAPLVQASTPQSFQAFPAQSTYPPQSYPPQSYPPQNYPPQNYPPQNYPPQNYPPQNFNNPGFNAHAEAEKNMKINQVLSMYSSQPPPAQNSGSTGFKPLGAIAAQNFFNQGGHSHPYPTF